MAGIGGIFIGGAATRAGGIAKGLLAPPDGGPSIVARSIALLQELDVTPVLVGGRADYDALGVHRIADGAGAGPLAGLSALLAYAACLEGPALVLACDMPFLTAASLARLLAAPPAPIVAARRDARWEPFFSRHDPHTVGPIAERHAREGRLSLQALFDAAGAVSLDVPPGELEDWDTIPIRTMSK